MLNYLNYLKYLNIACAITLTSHSYAVYLAARSAKDALLQAVASSGILAGFLLLLALMVQRFYPKFAVWLCVTLLLLLMATWLTSQAMVVLFWLVLAALFAASPGGYLWAKYRADQ